MGEGDVWAALDEAVIGAFESEYRRIYGMTIDDVPIEVVTWRLSARADPAEIAADDSEAPISVGDGQPLPTSTRTAVFGREQDEVEVPVYRREDLAIGMSFPGPALVEERETTSVIRPGWQVSVAYDACLVAVRDQRPTPR